VSQEAVAVLEDDTVEILSARILEAEHRIYPEAVRRLLSVRYRLDGRRVVFESEP
jgi:phosphoribosylglycinamide formyltransferase-1